VALKILPTENNGTLAEIDETKIIDDAVVFINETAKKTIYDGSLKIGNHILEHFFNNDIKLASSRNPKKQTSFYKLCEREDLTVHSSRLGLMVRVASQERYLSDNTVDLTQLSYTHKTFLVKLENDIGKLDIAKKCIDGNWTTRELEKQIAERIRLDPDVRRVSPLQSTSKYIKKIDEVLSIEDSALKFDDKELASMSDERRQGLGKKIMILKKKIEQSSVKTIKISEDCNNLLAKLENIAKQKKQNPPKRGKKAPKPKDK
jgi:hypothetical protein